MTIGFPVVALLAFLSLLLFLGCLRIGFRRSGAGGRSGPARVIFDSPA